VLLPGNLNYPPQLGIIAHGYDVAVASLRWTVTPTGQLALCREGSVMLTMYSTSWCGYCHRLKSQLERAGIDYQVIDIEQDAVSAEFVMKANGGNQTVPTIRIVPASGGDEIVMTNPSIVQVKAALAGTGVAG